MTVRALFMVGSFLKRGGGYPLPTLPTPPKDWGEWEGGELGRVGMDSGGDWEGDWEGHVGRMDLLGFVGGPHSWTLIRFSLNSRRMACSRSPLVSLRSVASGSEANVFGA